MHKVCFWFGLYNEVELANRLVTQLQTYYDNPEIICVLDGTDIKPLAASKITCIQGERLHLAEFGAAWVKRMFETFLDFSGASAMVRLEPDTYINQAFKNIPSCDIGGNILSLTNKLQYVHGGCVYFKREAVEKILESRLLDNLKYKTSEFSYKRFKAPYLLPFEKESTEEHIAEDIIFSDVIQQLKLQISNWQEVWSRIREDCPNPENYTVVHPVKSLCP